MKKNQILLVEDDESFGMLLQNYLELHNYRVDWAINGKQGWERYIEISYDLVICDIMMPKLDGFRLAEQIRKHNQDIPLIFLTAKSLKEDKLKGYDIGADDYLVKPFDSEILLRKIKALLKRNISATINETEKFHLNSLFFNSITRELIIDEQHFVLTPKEAKVLSILLENNNNNKITETEQLLLSIWGKSDFYTKRSLDVFISKIRNYLKVSKSHTLTLLNVHGKGYRIISSDH